MLKLDLTGSQKLQIGFVSAIFLTAGFLFIRNSRTPVDTTISTRAEPPHHVGMDPKLPISSKNPIDPAKTTLANVFDCHDGTLEIIEFAPESGHRAQFVFNPNLHRQSYDAYKDPMAKINAISDPYKHVLTLAAYGAANNRPMGLLSTADLDQDQRKSEKEFRQIMLDAVTLNDEGSKTGIYHPEMYEKVMAELALFKAMPGDSLKDPKKAAQAHKVMDLAMAYLDRLEADKELAIQKYVAAMDGILKADQKDKLGKESSQLANRPQGRRPRAG